MRRYYIMKKRINIKIPKKRDPFVQPMLKATKNASGPMKTEKIKIKKSPQLKDWEDDLI
jgi:hypothetical protein